MKQQIIEQENKELKRMIKNLVSSYNELYPDERTIAGMPVSKITSDILDKFDEMDDISKLDGE